MAAPIIVEEKPISMSEMKAELSKIKRRDKELNYRANKTNDYLNHFKVLDAKTATELYKKIEELDIPRIKEIHIKKIIDILPATNNELKSTLEAYPITVSAENIKKIASVVTKYL